MSPRFSWQAIMLRLRVPFRLSYGVSETRRSFSVRLAGDEGLGEAAIPPYYAVSDESMIALWESLSRSSAPFPDDPAGIEGWMGDAGPAPARCAVDLALHDRIGRRWNLPLWQLLSLPPPSSLATCFTIAIDEPEEMARQALSASAYETLKIKLGSEDDFARLKAVRAARPNVRLRIDANAGWDADAAITLVRRLEPLDIELIEQPVRKEDIAGMGAVQRATEIPVVADESCQSLADVEALAAAGVRGINLKLMKAGGLTNGVAMARRARELGMKVMLGCMIETSVGVTAMAHLAGLADWLDLDGPLLIANDPFDGIRYDEHGAITLPDRPGIGACERPDGFREPVRSGGD
jgi:L-alanine-DL-glutamate epimerase-like enolase superfamily enzyme